jgi:hypothetical protein
MAKEEKKTVFRDSGKGQFISKREYERRPADTVERERVRVNPSPKKK